MKYYLVLKTDTWCIPVTVYNRKKILLIKIKKSERAKIIVLSSSHERILNVYYQLKEANLKRLLYSILKSQNYGDRKKPVAAKAWEREK